MNKTAKIKQSFQVSYHFDILFTDKLFDPANSLLTECISKNSTSKAKAIIVLDKGVSKAHPALTRDIKRYFSNYASQIELCGEILEIPGGEQLKNDPVFVKRILKKVHVEKIDRHSFIIAIGGGAVLDVVGFSAAIAHRGIRLIRVPTTVLSQNDSGTGVKNGINCFGKKNFTGSFALPFAVINDASFLTTLSDRDWRSGISEAIKVALIKDSAFFYQIKQNVETLNNRDITAMNSLIFRCAQLHSEHIGNSGDPFERGSSRPLDFGHWAAHKLEQTTGYSVRHGEAVAVGIALDTVYSFLSGLTDQQTMLTVLNCLADLGFTLFYPELTERIIGGLEEFREHLGGKLTIMLLKKIGEGVEVHTIDKTRVVSAIAYLKAYHFKRNT